MACLVYWLIVNIANEAVVTNPRRWFKQQCRDLVLYITFHIKHFQTIPTYFKQLLQYFICIKLLQMISNGIINNQEKSVFKYVFESQVEPLHLLFIDCQDTILVCLSVFNTGSWFVYQYLILDHAKLFSLFWLIPSDVLSNQFHSSSPPSNFVY